MRRRAQPVADQIAIAHRLHLLASTFPPRYPVTVMAGELMALLNGFWQESRRADQAEARLIALASSQQAGTKAEQTVN